VHVAKCWQFDSLVEEGPTADGCDFSTGGTGKDGYGRFFIYRAGICVRPHRYALARWLAVPLGPDELGLHECDKPLCVKVCDPGAVRQQVVVGTQGDNMRRMARMRRGGSRRAIPSDGLHARRDRSVALRALLREQGWGPRFAPGHYPRPGAAMVVAAPHVFRGGGGPSISVKPTGTSAPLLTTGAGEVVAAVWRSPNSAEPCGAADTTSWRSLTTTPPTDPPRPSTAAWKPCAATPSDSATSPTTAGAHCCTAEDSTNLSMHSELRRAFNPPCAMRLVQSFAFVYVKAGPLWAPCSGKSAKRLNCEIQASRSVGSVAWPPT
jgi:hypothetical protein